MMFTGYIKLVINELKDVFLFLIGIINGFIKLSIITKSITLYFPQILLALLFIKFGHINGFSQNQHSLLLLPQGLSFLLKRQHIPF